MDAVQGGGGGAARVWLGRWTLGARPPQVANTGRRTQSCARVCILISPAQAFGPAMRMRGADGVNSAAAWINILSVYALENWPPYGAYSASQAACLSLSHCLRAELRPGTAVGLAFTWIIATAGRLSNKFTFAERQALSRAPGRPHCGSPVILTLTSSGILLRTCSGKRS